MAAATGPSRFAPAASDPTLCQYCWSRKEAHEPLGECPRPASARPDASP